MSTYGSRALQSLGISRSSSAYRSLSRTYWGLRSIRGSRTYSQFGEDAVLGALLSDSTGFYVDVGAGHPTQGSNTFALYRRGWRGVLVEPLAANVTASRVLRRGDRVVQALCGDRNGSIPFYEFDAWQLSTTSPEVVQRLASEGHFPVTMTEVSMVRLRDLGLAADPDSPSLLSIDVEGAEVAVLDGNDWNVFLPAVVCLEQWESPLEGASILSDKMVSLGYLLYNFVGNSGIWLHASSRLRP
jgi:FkbM family methyltransferase